ncbi:aminopeptidase N isoform X1 [Drosophila guanche]|uniref:Aminopeptidase n=1 Tax=Drosophila guanche TaxID=7266 RepID=A0A3B0JKW3_DROGU|nr:aminopeptidase N isoform X1 [Drosophila guanche]SPP82967.1 blast:Thyrotropin-releasing hormone-degrading ectoenzyme [Drosophila guanche]
MITPSSGFAGLVLAVALALSGVSGSLPTRDRSLRLPNETYPLGYHLHISSNIHLGNLLFSGNATIDVAIRQSTNEIVLHAKNLSDYQITVRQLTPSGSVDVVDDLTHTYNPQAAFLIIHPRENYQAFEAGQRYRVEILYTAIMRSRPMGLYWMDYVDESTNRTVYVAATQSEPTYARLIFPCYDEPGFKSNFSIRLTHGINHSAISNMPVKDVQHHGELTTTLFAATPPMSTYLVAFVISDFEHISETYRGVTQRIYSSPRSKEKGQSALKNAVRTVAAMEDYFGVSYPLQKLDHIALKKNYGAAMENWGLITFKEGNLLHQDTGDVHKRVKDKITQNHEIAHQWFGNLVSPEWWSYAWMNEGFATYFAYVITDLLYPEDKVMDMFVSDEGDRAYSYNSFFDVRPMTSYVETEKEIMAIFDIITYKRAACVIKMFHHAFKQKIFVRGISRFLEKYKYTVANELNLFDYLQAELLEDEHFGQQPWVLRVREIMLSWTHSEWMPIVLVTRNYENDTITFSQRSIHSKSEHWWIPLNFATAQKPCFEETQADLFIPPQTQHSLSLAELNLQLTGRDWLIVNKQQTGFYHVHYDTDNLRAISRQLRHNHTLIHPVNRAALFRDLKPQIEHTELEDIDVVLDMLKYMEFEEDLLPWNQVADTIDFVRRNLFATSSLELFNEFVRQLVTPTFRRLFRDKTSGEVPNSDLDAGQAILLMACLADLPECLDHTRTLAKEYIFKRINVTNESEYFAMYDSILCLGVRYLSDKDFYGVIGMMQAADRSSIYYDDLIYSLRCTQSHSHLLYFLELLLGENSTHLILSDPESMMYLSYLYKSNMEARSVIWQYIDRNYKLLCRSPNFVENFNQIAEFVPRQQKPHFVLLRQNIAAYMEVQGLNHTGAALIDIDSGLVGKKMKNTEVFVDKYEQKIHNWLLAEVPQMSAQKEAIYAASLSVGNGSNRPQGLLNTASEVVQKALRSIDRSLYR